MPSTAPTKPNRITSDTVSVKTDSNVTKPTHEYYKNLGKYGKLGGRPRTGQVKLALQDEAQAFESIKEKWNYISHKLADEASKAARDTKKIDGRSLVALTTAAGIAYDKRWSKQVSDNTEIEIPASLQAALTTKLAKPLITQESDCMIQGKSCSEADLATDQPVDPLLLSPGL